MAIDQWDPSAPESDLLKQGWLVPIPQNMTCLGPAQCQCNQDDEDQGCEVCRGLLRDVWADTLGWCAAYFGCGIHINGPFPCEKMAYHQSQIRYSRRFVISPDGNTYLGKMYQGRMYRRGAFGTWEECPIPEGAMVK